MSRWGRAANEEARAKREARLVEIGDIKNIPVRIPSSFFKKIIFPSIILVVKKIPSLLILQFSPKVGKISDVAANVSIGYQPEVNLCKIFKKHIDTDILYKMS